MSHLPGWPRVRMKGPTQKPSSQNWRTPNRDCFFGYPSTTPRRQPSNYDYDSGWYLESNLSILRVKMSSPSIGVTMEEDQLNSIKGSLPTTAPPTEQWSRRECSIRSASVSSDKENTYDFFDGIIITASAERLSLREIVVPAIFCQKRSQRNPRQSWASQKEASISARMCRQCGTHKFLAVVMLAVWAGEHWIISGWSVVPEFRGQFPDLRHRRTGARPYHLRVQRILASLMSWTKRLESIMK